MGVDIRRSYGEYEGKRKRKADNVGWGGTEIRSRADRECEEGNVMTMVK
jgi:hypothetical protein